MTDYQPDRRHRARKGLVAIALLVTVGIVGAAAWGSSVIAEAMAAAPPPTDAYGCKSAGGSPSDVDSGSNAHLFVLVDASDPLSPTIRDRARKLVDMEIEKLPDFGRVTVAPLSTSALAPLREPFTACRLPPENPLWRFSGKADPYEAKRERITELRARYDELLETEASSDPSPLIEAVAAIGRREDFSPRSQNKTLIIISDLYQRSGWFDLYAGPIDADAVVANDRWGAFPDLTDTRVLVLQTTERGANYDGRMAEAAASFWARVFKRARADATIERVEFDLE